MCTKVFGLICSICSVSVLYSVSCAKQTFAESEKRVIRLEMRCFILGLENILEEFKLSIRRVQVQIALNHTVDRPAIFPIPL